MADPTPAPSQIPNWRRKGLISLDSTDEQVKEFLDLYVNPLSPRRRWNTQRAAMNTWMYLGRQWIEPRAELAPGDGTYHFREIYRNSAASFPRPVTNIIAPAVDNEVSRLTRKEYVPDTSAGKNDPEWMAGARLAKDIVMWEMAKQLWNDKREFTAFNLCIDGTAILRTWWDENDTELTLISTEDPAKCPHCGRLFSSRRVPRSFQTVAMPGEEGPLELLHAETLRDVEEQGEATAMHPKGIPQVELTLCPFHPEAASLEDFLPNEEEAGGQDAFGRQMGVFVPKGDALVDVVTMHEFFPENAGVGLDPDEARLWNCMTVRPLEWIALRYPEIADKVEAEDAQLLMRLNPLYAEPGLAAGTTAYGYTTSPGIDVYANHARVIETFIAPQPHIEGLEMGGWFIRVGDEIVRRPLCEEVEGEEDKVHVVPRVKFHFARFKRVPKNFWGRTFVDDLVPIQRRLNEIDAMAVDLRERGKPNMWTPSGTEISSRDDLEGSLVVIEYDSALTGWTPRDGLFPGGPLSGNEYLQERQNCFTDAQLVGAPQDIEIGQAPGSVKTTSGLMLLSEEAAAKRGMRERSLAEMYEGAFKHLLQLNHVFRKDEVSYEVFTEAGIYERRSYKGTDLLANVNIKMDARAGYDQTLYNKEAAGEALQLGLYKLDSPAAIDRLLDLMKLPKDVNEEQHLQIIRAEMAWSDFLDNEKIPVVDETMHDAAAWYAVLGKRWMTDKAYILQSEASWEEVLPRIAGWQETLMQMELQDQQLRQIYGAFPREQWGQIYSQGMQLHQQAVQAQQAAQAAQQAQFNDQSADPQMGDIAAAPPPPEQIPPFPKPPVDGFLPNSKDRRIYVVWRRMMPDLEEGILAAEAAKAKGVRMTPELQKMWNIDRLLQMRAVIEAYRMIAIESMAPAPAPGAPGEGPPPEAPPAPQGGPGGN